MWTYKVLPNAEAVAAFLGTLKYGDAIDAKVCWRTLPQYDVGYVSQEWIVFYFEFDPAKYRLTKTTT